MTLDRFDLSAFAQSSGADRAEQAPRLDRICGGPHHKGVKGASC